MWETRVTSLEQLGYQSEVYFDHNGKYGDYLKTLHDLGGLKENIHDLSKLAVKYNAFDGSAIRSDADLFTAYINNVANNGSVNNITFMNLLSLHDGNRLAGEKKSQSYAPRLKLLLDDLEDFIENTNTFLRPFALIKIVDIYAHFSRFITVDKSC